jgi:peptide/nickel transport system substrate-binding protein
MRTVRWKVGVALIGVLSLLGAACGGDDDDEAEGTGATTTAAEEGAAEEGATNESAPAGELDREATFRYAYSIGTSSFDPSKASSSFDNVALFLTYDRLVHLSPEGEGIPGLAESWEFSEDGSSLTMQLREGVTFHDGAEFTAEVAKANLERNKAGTSVGDLAPVGSVDVVDPLTIRLNFTAPGGAIPLILSDRAGAMVSPNAINDPGLDLNPVGAGMYRVVEYQKDARVVYERFEDYWDPDAVGAATFELVILPDNVAAFNAIQSHQVDAGIIVPSQRSEAEGAGLEVLEGPTLAVYHLQLNRSKPFLDDTRVRRAISMAIDREALLEGIALGQGEVSVQHFPSDYWAANPDIGPDEIPYDIEGAKALLEEAGVPEGQSYSVIVPTTNVYPQLAEAVKDMVADIGINLEIVPTDPVQTASVFYSQQQGDALVSVWGGRHDPAQSINLLFTEGPLQNPGGHTTPEITRLAAEASQPGTPEERSEALHAVVKEIVDEQMNPVLYLPTGLVAYWPDVSGMAIYSSAKPEFRGVGIAAE